MNAREQRLRERIDVLTDRNHDLAAQNAEARVELQHNLAELRAGKAKLRKARSRLRERTSSRDLWRIKYAALRADRDVLKLSCERAVREQRRVERVLFSRFSRGKDAA